MFQKIKKQLFYLSNFIPFTRNTLFIGFVFGLIWYLLYEHAGEKDFMLQYPFLWLLGKIVFWFTICLFTLSAISALFAWLYYLWLRRHQKTRFDIRFESEQKSSLKHAYFVTATIEGAIRPWLGFVKGRLFYDQESYSDLFSLQSNKKVPGKIFRTGITGRFKILFPDIREYQIKQGLVYFRDMFGVLSLPVKEQVQGQFYQQPYATPLEETDVSPHISTQTDIRTDTLHRVEGEYLNYKDFEPGDDVRRIVWKYYARNRELVVRIPERFEPFASHIPFYASFHNTFSNHADAYQNEMLNYYKNNIWSVYQSLNVKRYPIQYIPDQHFPDESVNINTEEAVARYMSKAMWQKEISPEAYLYKPTTGAILCISSFTDVKSLEAVLDQSGNRIAMIYYSQCSKAFRAPVAMNWLVSIFLQPPRDRLVSLRKKWPFMPMRRQIKRNEKNMIQLLQRYEIPYQIL